MTPLEQYQHDKRSGLYESTTEPKAEPAAKPYQAPSEPQAKPSKVVLPDPYGEQTRTIRAMYKDITGLEKDMKKIKTWALVIGILIILWLAALTYFRAETVTVTEVRTKTKVKKIYVAQKSSKWREKLCYAYGDWNACLAYKENLPARARVGRMDL